MRAIEMKATIKTKSGLTYSVIVRWSNAIGGLYTTGRMLSACTGGRVAIGNVMCASAPIAVYDGEWNDYGFTESLDFYDEKNLVGKIPFCDMNWNYQ